jgi:hypothetical protein
MVTVAVDSVHGGRWTSLRAAGREWLWHRPDPARAGVRPGDPFVDAGGVEECIPTVRGRPDHGDVWSRPWTATGVEGDGFRTYRSIGVEPMLGRVFDRALAGPGDAAVVPASGFCEWRLRVSAA